MSKCYKENQSKKKCQTTDQVYEKVYEKVYQPFSEGLEARREVICEVASQCFLQFARASSQKPLVTHKFSSKGS